MYLHDELKYATAQAGLLNAHHLILLLSSIRLIMPEYVENITGGKICHLFLKDSTPCGRKILSIYADATNNEASGHHRLTPLLLSVMYLI